MFYALHIEIINDFSDKEQPHTGIFRTPTYMSSAFPFAIKKDNVLMSVLEKKKINKDPSVRCFIWGRQKERECIW